MIARYQEQGVDTDEAIQLVDNISAAQSAIQNAITAKQGALSSLNGDSGYNSLQSIMDNISRKQ